jgi:hypothetical protein
LDAGSGGIVCSEIETTASFGNARFRTGRLIHTPAPGDRSMCVAPAAAANGVGTDLARPEKTRFGYRINDRSVVVGACGAGRRFRVDENAALLAKVVGKRMIG